MKPYIYKTTVTIGDTNCFQNVYFLNYLKITGFVRELWVKDCVQNFDTHLASGLMLINSSASCDFIKDFFVFQPIRCEMSVQKLKHASGELVFRFFHDVTNELHAEARHKIVFADRSHKICAMPEDFRNAAEDIEEL